MVSTVVGLAIQFVRTPRHCRNVSRHEQLINSAITDICSIAARLGFWPSDSVVAQWRVGAEEKLVQRIDLPTTSIASHLRECFNDPVRLHRPTTVAFWVIGELSGERELETVEHLTDLVTTLDLKISTLSFVSQNNLRSLECGESCAPHLMNARVFGQGAIRSRSELVDACAYRSEVGVSLKAQENAQSNVQAHAGNTQWRSDEVFYIRGILSQRKAPSELTIARVAQALTNINVRDTLLWDLAAGEINGGIAAASLTKMLPHIQGSWVAPLATVAGICWWLNGNGVMANICNDRAYESRNGYALSTLLKAALTSGLSPGFWVDSVLELNRETCLNGGKVA